MQNDDSGPFLADGKGLKTVGSSNRDQGGCVNIPHSDQFISKSDPRILSYKDNPTYAGNPDALYFARDFRDVAEILKECNERKLPVTFCGSRTSLTGSSAANEGLVVSLEKKD